MERRAPKCLACNDLGWIAPDVAVGHPDFGVPKRCKCREGADLEKRRKYLEGVDGLTEGERKMEFGQFRVSEHNRGAYQATVDALASQRGIITLTGEWGKGKSLLLICAVNQARSQGKLAVYTRMADLLSYLRRAFDPGASLASDERWDLLNRTDVLAIDEMDRFNGTPWSLEQFFLLIDNRWRDIDSRLTLFATNTPISKLPGEINSRLGDGRAIACELSGPDMRPLEGW